MRIKFYIVFLSLFCVCKLLASESLRLQADTVRQNISIERYLHQMNKLC